MTEDRIHRTDNVTCPSDLRLLDSVIRTASLPPLVRRLIHLIGLNETYKLLAARGSLTTVIPSTLERSSELQKILSPQAVKALVDAMPNIRLELTSVRKFHNQIRNAAIRADRQSMTYPELTQKYGLTRRMLINICGSNEHREKQK